MKKFAFWAIALIAFALAFSLTLAVSAGAAVEPSSFPAFGPEMGAGFLVGGLIINTENLSIIFTAFKANFNTGFRMIEGNWNRFATLIPSTTKTEKYGWLGQFPKLKEWVGDRHVKGMEAHDYSIKNKKFESTIAVPRDDLDDDTYGLFAPLLQEMGFAAASHPDELVFALIESGFVELCYDGQPFFDADHPVDGASVSNLQAGGGSPWYMLDLSRPLKPFIFQRRKDYELKFMTDGNDEAVFMRDEYRYGVDARANTGFAFWQQAYASKDALDQANFDAAIEAMMGFKSDEGRPLGIKPNTLLVGASNRAAAKAVVEKELIAAGESNPNYKAVEVVVSPWLP